MRTATFLKMLLLQRQGVKNIGGSKDWNHIEELNAYIIGENCTVSDGVQSGGEEPIFIGPITGVKILSTSDIIIRSKKTYSRNMTSKREQYLSGQLSLQEVLGDCSSIGQSATKMQIGKYQLLDYEEELHAVGDFGEESDDEEKVRWRKTEARPHYVCDSRQCGKVV